MSRFSTRMKSFASQASGWVNQSINVSMEVRSSNASRPVMNRTLSRAKVSSGFKRPPSWMGTRDRVLKFKSSAKLLPQRHRDIEKNKIKKILATDEHG